MQSQIPVRKALLIAVAAATLLIAGALVWWNQGPAPEPPTARGEVEKTVSSSSRALQPVNTAGAPAKSLPTRQTQSTTPRANAETFDTFRLRPFAVTTESATNGWTAEDARSPDVIRQIAHNEVEVARMLEENDRIHRRQLVYRNETADVAVQRAMADGRPVSRLALPGLDGQELEFEVVSTDLAPSGQSGSLAGHLAGKPESQVVLSFRSGREAFSVSSPEDGLYLQADPREPGELIVKSIDPATYIQGSCGNPEHDH